MKKTIPLLISRNTVIFPNSIVDLPVGRELSIAAVNYAIEQFNSEIVVVCQKNYETDHPVREDFFTVATLSKIILINKEHENSIRVQLQGIKRVLITTCGIDYYNEDHNQPQTWFCEFEALKEKNATSIKNKSLLSELIYQFECIYSPENHDLVTIKDILEKKTNSFPVVTDMLACLWPCENNNDIHNKQKWLEETDVTKRIKLILNCEFMCEQTKDSIDELINKKVNSNISKQQKEFYLRERIKVIKEELGEGVTAKNDLQKIKNTINNGKYPIVIQEKVLNELNKLESISMISNESIVIRNYIDWMISLPWYQYSEDEKDILKVEASLEKSHFGLEKIKKRIVEYIAVQKRTKQPNGTIICLVGPPGVGKTSLAYSIAKALNKTYVKISLGGVYDESEIRGHRKTYVGSMPGRIIKSMKTAKVKNPLILLDELDKLSNDNRGDPSSALLEVLDPKQNAHFSDNYIEEEFDLSKVMFVATANYEENIPEALIDRLEIIHLTSYTENEKLAIAQEHLIAEVLSEHGILAIDLQFEQEAIKYIIRRYTREAGVRNLKQFLSQIARKFVCKQEKNTNFKQMIKVPDVIQYLKKEIYDYTLKDEESLPGIVNGMAYTQYGGDLLPIEVNYFDGKGNLNLTGNLKETMKESANVALSYIKANVKQFGLTEINWQNIDLNLHVPSGGIPKDGPSAGITITTAIISALLKIPVDNNIAMTGEITLRGKVLIIGGVKEKVISAARGGITKIYMPRLNERYIEDIPKEIMDKIEIVFVDHYYQVFDQIFQPKLLAIQQNTLKQITTKKISS